MPSLADYEAVIAIAEEAHFGRAAQRLQVSQPALSSRLRRIEEALGCRLFDRDRTGVFATPAGLQFVEGAQRVVLAAREADTSARNAHAGHGQLLRIGMTQIAAYQCVSDVLRAFLVEHSSTRVRLTEGTTARLERELDQHHIDVAFLHPPLHSSSLSEKKLLRVHGCLYEQREDGPSGRIIRFPRAEAPVIMSQLSGAFESFDNDTAAEADTLLGAIVLSRAGLGGFVAPSDYASPFGLMDGAIRSEDLDLHLDTSIAWRSLDRRPLLRDLVSGASEVALSISAKRPVATG